MIKKPRVPSHLGIGEGSRRLPRRSAEAAPGGVKDGSTRTRSWEETGKGVRPVEKTHGSKVAARAQGRSAVKAGA